METKEITQRRNEIFEKLNSKYDEIRAFGKAHSPAEKNGLDFKTKMKLYKQELNAIKLELGALIIKKSY